MCNLSIQEISLQNYRKFSEIRYRLNPKMNVFAGRNGSGKTAMMG